MHNVAFCHHALGDLHEARRIYEQVLAMRGEIEETVARASSQRNYAEVLFDLGRLEEALAAATEALTTKRQAEDLAYLPSCLSLIGDIESEIGRTERAREAFLEVLREFPDHPSENFHCEMGMARLEEVSGKRDDAKRRYEKLLESTARASSDAEALLAVYQALQFFREQGASSEKLREIAERALGGRFAVDLPLAELFRRQIAASRSMAEGCVEEAKIHLREALARSWKLGMAERIWRIQRDLSMLEPKGSRAAEAELASARAIVESQARLFRRKDLRSAYSAHPERAVILGGVVR
jgi:tetratricopeptide (TPR) repeat protein